MFWKKKEERTWKDKHQDRLEYAVECAILNKNLSEAISKLASMSLQETYSGRLVRFLAEYYEKNKTVEELSPTHQLDGYCLDSITLPEIKITNYKDCKELIEFLAISRETLWKRDS